MVGLFINVIPIRIQVLPEAPLLAWLRKSQEAQAEAPRQRHHSSLAQIQTWSEMPPGLSLFESTLSFQNYPVDEATRSLGRSLGIRQVRGIERSSYPLDITIGPGEFRFMYDRSRFEEAAISRMATDFGNLLTKITQQPGVRIADLLELLTQNKKKRQKEVMESKYRQLKAFKPKTVDVSIAEQAGAGPGLNGTSFPMVVQAGTEGVDADQWLKTNQDSSKRDY